MPRFFCDYCHSYLTHDTPSVRKSHLLGKNHLRLAGDYYCNKARQDQRPFLPRTRKPGRDRRREGKPQLAAVQKTGPQRKFALHCDTNRQKRLSRQSSAIRAQEVAAKCQVLEKLYAKSPGYAKVFRPECRLDTGQSVRLDRAPQRANRRPFGGSNASGSAAADGGGSASNIASAHVTRTVKFSPDYASTRTLALLPPPPSLSQWPSCPPLLLASDRAAATTLRDVTRKLERR
ncbi:LAME_0C06590g1_1 [Lachancea meyersii CBS 8951]|uniref:LAME_0C06590g1_1 n=1 Tax=Lachancea meyersii CBS 8951 TaxID=1266667 RepID=A0A1G4J2U2_9SACH|nr:LAME_0C06590g1_1 [Lachancea meyersii CBS 8951]